MVSQEKLRIMSKTGFSSPQNRDQDFNVFSEGRKPDFLSQAVSESNDQQNPSACLSSKSSNQINKLDPYFSEQYRKIKDDKMIVKQALKSHQMMSLKKSAKMNLKTS